jgi:hypothetical protein
VSGPEFTRDEGVEAAELTSRSGEEVARLGRGWETAAREVSEAAVDRLKRGQPEVRVEELQNDATRVVEFDSNDEPNAFLDEERSRGYALQVSLDAVVDEVANLEVGEASGDGPEIRAILSDELGFDELGE